MGVTPLTEGQARPPSADISGVSASYLAGKAARSAKSRSCGLCAGDVSGALPDGVSAGGGAPYSGFRAKWENSME